MRGSRTPYTKKPSQLPLFLLSTRFVMIFHLVRHHMIPKSYQGPVREEPQNGIAVAAVHSHLPRSPVGMRGGVIWLNHGEWAATPRSLVALQIDDC